VSSVIPGFSITHTCRPCRTFAQEAGRCSVCDEWMEPVTEVGHVTQQPAPCPDWPDSELDGFERAPTRTPKTRTRTRTRTGHR
jgi:hypothetical protein